MSKYIKKIPLVGPVVETGKGLYEAGKGGKEIYNSFGDIKEKGIIDSSKEAIKGGKNIYVGTRKVMQNLPKAIDDASRLLEILGQDTEKITSMNIIKGVDKHLGVSKDRHAMLGIMFEFQSVIKAAGAFKDRMFRFMNMIGSKVRDAKDIVKSSIKDAIWLDADGDVIFSNEEGLFKINREGVVSLNPEQIGSLIRLDTISKLIDQKAKKQSAYKDEDNNKYIIEETKDGMKLKQFFDGKEYKFVEKYVDGPWPELISIGKNYKQEVERWDNIGKEISEITQQFNAGRYTTAQAMLKEKRIRELQNLVNSDKRFGGNHLNRDIIDFLIDKAVASGVDPKLIQGVLNDDTSLDNKEVGMITEIINIQFKEGLTEAAKQKQLRGYLKSNGYNVDKFLKENNIGINQFLKYQEQLSILANTAREYNPTLMQDIGYANTFGFLNFVGGSIELFTKIPIGQLLGVGFSTIMMLMLSKTVKIGAIAAYKLTKAAIVALWRYFNSKPKEKLIPYKEVSRLMIEAKDKEEENKWWNYIVKHYPKEAGLDKIRTPAFKIRNFAEINELKENVKANTLISTNIDDIPIKVEQIVEDQDIEMMDNTKSKKAKRIPPKKIWQEDVVIEEFVPKQLTWGDPLVSKEVFEDQKLELINNESKKLKSMPKRPSIQQCIFALAHSKDPAKIEKWKNKLKRYYPLAYNSAFGEVLALPSPETALVPSAPPPPQFLESRIPRNHFSTKVPSDIMSRVIEVNSNTPSDATMPPPIVSEPEAPLPQTTEVPKFISDFKFSPGVSSRILKEFKATKFKAEKPEPGISLNAFMGPRYVYKTPKQMRSYQKQSKKRGLKRKWRRGVSYVRHVLTH